MGLIIFMRFRIDVMIVVGSGLWLLFSFFRSGVGFDIDELIEFLIFVFVEIL